MKGMVVSATTVVLIALAIRKYVHFPKSIDFNAARPSKKETMRAIAYSRHGDASVLEVYHNYPKPQCCGPHQVLIKIHASSLNPCDFKFRRNAVARFALPKPKIPGQDVAGRIVQLGPDVQRFQTGDRVAAMLPLFNSRYGAAADYVVVDASLVAKMGGATSYRDAAALPLTSLTVLQALHPVTTTTTTTNQKILVQAGAGGVGTFAIQYAKRVLGMHTVVATASEAKADLLRELGCDKVLDYHKERFEQVVEDFDVVLDTMSWAYEDRILNSRVLKAKGGHYLNIMSSDWGFEGKRERINGPRSIVRWLYYKLWPVLRYDLIAVEPDGNQLQTVMDLLDNKTIRAVVDRQFHLTQAKEAYEYLERGHATGKVVLDHGNDEEVR